MVSLETPSGEDLALRARRRKGCDFESARQACQQLYQRHACRLLAFLAARIPRSDLEDLHHGVWLRVWENLPDGFDGRNSRAWLYQIARNLLADQFRRRRPNPLDAADELAEARAANQPLAVLLEQERRHLLEECLKRLDTRLAEFVGGRLAGEGYDELCQRLGLKPAQGHKLFRAAESANPRGESTHASQLPCNRHHRIALSFSGPSCANVRRGQHVFLRNRGHQAEPNLGQER
jgi:RNA polymerase sigma-70 factor (ECF subfamily)